MARPGRPRAAKLGGKDLAGRAPSKGPFPCRTFVSFLTLLYLSPFFSLSSLAFAQAKTEIVKLEMKKASRQEFKPHEIKAQKKRVAQLLTVKREREIEQGVSKRESKRAEK